MNHTRNHIPQRLLERCSRYGMCKASLEQNSEFDPVTKSENSLSTSSSDINVQVNMTENEFFIVSKYKTETKQDKNIYIVSALGKRLERSIMKDCGY